LNAEGSTPPSLCGGGVTELKVKQPDSFAAALLETYCNMYGETVKLTVNTLNTGKLVKTATMYDVLVVIHQEDKASLLKLTIDYFNRVCKFKK